MAVKKKAMRVQRYAARDCFAKKVGRHRGADGQTRPKVWYFPSVDEAEAISRAAWLKAEWRRLRALGHTAWPDGFAPPWKTATAVVERSGTAAPAPALQTASETRAVRVGDLTLKDALKLYQADLQRRESSVKDRISPARSRNAYNFAAKAVEHLGAETRLSEVERGRLVGTVEYFAARPIVKSGERMSPESARSYVANTSTFFRWVAAQPFGWRKPDEFDQIWRLGDLQPLTEDERERQYEAKAGRGVQLFGLPQLAMLYREADALERSWILLGLNCAFQNVDVSDLRDYEVREGYRDGHAAIIRERQKTGVEGRWVLWPETLAALRAAQSPKNGQRRVFLTSRGNTLVGRSSRSDYVAQRWADLRERARARELADLKARGEPLDGAILASVPSFKHLRKQSADAIKQLGGSDEISKVHRCHAESNDLSANYTNRLWEQTHELQIRMREHFAPVWAD